MSEIAPHTLAEFVDPLKEWFTWNWVIAVFLTLWILFTEFVLFGFTLITSHYILAVLFVFSIAATLCIFGLFFRTPAVLNENISRVMFEGRIKHGIDTFSKYSPTVKKWVIRNFTGLIEIDEETGLCREKPNQEMY